MRIPANLLAETTYTVNVSMTLIRGEGEEHALIVNKALAFMVYGERVTDGRRAAPKRRGEPVARVDAADGAGAVRV